MSATPRPPRRRADCGSLTPGSTNWHVAQALLGVTGERGHALTLAECRAAYAAYRDAHLTVSHDASRSADDAPGAGSSGTGSSRDATSRAATSPRAGVLGGVLPTPPPPLSPQRVMTALHQLLRSGVVHAVGRRRHLQFWHHAHPVPPRPDVDLAAALVAAVEAAYARHRRAVSSQEVTAELRAALATRGLTFADLALTRGVTRHGLSTLMRTLAGGYDDPRCRTRRLRTRWIVGLTTTTATGRTWRWWLPVGAPEAAAVLADEAAAGTAPGAGVAAAPSPAPASAASCNAGERTAEVGTAAGDAVAVGPGVGGNEDRPGGGPDRGPAGEPAPGPPGAVLRAPSVIVGPAPGSVDAIRRCVIAAVEALRRPVSLQEAWWWADGNAARDPVARAAAAGRWRERVLQALRRDAPLAGRPGRFVPIGTAFTCYAGSPLRFVNTARADTGEADAAAEAADARGVRRCVLADTLVALRAGEEWAELTAHARRVGPDLRGDACDTFTADRRAILAAGLRAAMHGPDDRPGRGIARTDGTDGRAGAADPHDEALARLSEAVAAERTALGLLASWAEAAAVTPGRRYYRLQLLARRRADLDAAEPAARADRAAGAAADPPDPGAVHVPLAAIAPLAAAAAAALGLTGAGAAGNLLKDARRFPNATPTPVAAPVPALVPPPTRASAKGRAGSPGGRPNDGLRAGSSWGRSPGYMAAYDRVDAVLCCLDAVGPARATALLARARRVVGHTFRDAARVAAAAEAATTPGDQRAFTLALGLLGDVDGVTRIVRAWDPGDPAAAASAALALVVADPGGAARRLAALDGAARGAAQPVTDRALIRAEHGLLLSVLE